MSTFENLNWHDHFKNEKVNVENAQRIINEVKMVNVIIILVYFINY